jgi:hypothetical protein
MRLRPPASQAARTARRALRDDPLPQADLAVALLLEAAVQDPDPGLLPILDELQRTAGLLRDARRD